MTLAAGTRLGNLAIVAPIGSGGVGDVYRARDEKLERDVAVKVLPDDVASDSLDTRFDAGRRYGLSPEREVWLVSVALW